MHRFSVEGKRSPGVPAILMVLAMASTMVLNIILPTASAQVSGSAILGAITNEKGLPVPNAEVAATDIKSNVTQMVSTDARGRYAFPDLPASSYEIKVTAAGFKTRIFTGVVLAVDDKLLLTVVLMPGDGNDVVRGSVAATQANQTTSAVEGNVNASTVRNAPLNGRDWTQLATLQAGVTGVQNGSSQGGGNTERGFGAALSISGARPDQNNFRLDGISINDYANGAPGSVLGDNLGVDAVEQFSVLGSNYPAQYGRTSGGVINAVTRSGSNAYHGSVYEFLRNSALDARNFFDGRNIPPFKRNQFGASGGGPIQKDGTFFFADYEGLRQSLGVTTVDTVPSANARTGQLSTGAVVVDPQVARFLAAFYPLPNNGLLGAGDTGIYSFAGQQITNENYFTTRVDRNFSAQDSVSATYMHDSSNVVQPDAFNDLILNVVSKRQVLTLHEQHLFSAQFANNAKFGFNRAIGIDGGVSRILNPLRVDTSYAYIPGQFAGAIEGIPGVTNLLTGPIAQNPAVLGNSKSLTWNSFQGGDDAVLTRGMHALQFGAVVERIQDNAFEISGTNGTFRFSSLENFLTNQPRTFQGLKPPLLTFGTRQTIFGAYLQDDIKLFPKFTLNAGLRYEMATVPTDIHNRISNLRHLSDAQPQVGAPYFLNPTLRNFEPRIGFAWSPFKDNKTSLRGGFGMFDVLPLPYTFELITPYAVPFSLQVFVNDGLPPGSFPSGAFQEFADSSTVARATYVEHQPKRSYVMQWNFGVAREITTTLVATVAYVGSRGVHQPYKMDNFDTVLPTLTTAGYVYPSNGQRLNPNFGRISGMLWQANSFYDALQVDLTKRVSHGVEIHGAYTWAKSIDTLSATMADDAYPNGLMNPPFFDQRTTRGLSDFNVGQELVINFTWEVPAPRVRSEFAKRALDGWQFGGIYKASSGQPFTPLVGGDPLGTKLDEISNPPNRITGPGCSSLTNPGNPNHYIKTQCLAFLSPGLRGNLGRNTLLGPGISKFDVSVFKNNHIHRISETFNAQFRAEFFNVFNRANFSSPTDNLAVFDEQGAPVPGAGLITSTQTTSRQIQLALKLIF